MARSPVHGVDSNTIVPGQTSYLILSIGAGGLGLDRSAVTALAAIERIRQGVLAESDLQRARALLTVEFLQAQEGLAGLAIQIARHEHLADFKRWKETLRGIESVTREEVVAAARRYFDLQRCTLLEYQPASEETRQFNSDSYREFLRMALPRAVGEVKGDDWIEVPLPAEKEPDGSPAAESEGPQGNQYGGTGAAPEKVFHSERARRLGPGRALVAPGLHGNLLSGWPGLGTSRQTGDYRSDGR